MSMAVVFMCYHVC